MTLRCPTCQHSMAWPPAHGVGEFWLCETCAQVLTMAALSAAEEACLSADVRARLAVERRGIVRQNSVDI